MTTRVALVGGTGKLGGIIREVVEAEEGFELVAVLSSQSPLSDLDGADLIVEADNLPYLRTLPSESFRLIYIDPPFNTGRTQSLQTTKALRTASASRVGFAGRSYETVKGMLHSYDDAFTDYWAFLEPRLLEAWRLLTPDGTLYLHLDYREVHYAKVVLDAMRQ